MGDWSPYSNGTADTHHGEYFHTSNRAHLFECYRFILDLYYRFIFFARDMPGHVIEKQIKEKANIEKCQVVLFAITY